MRKELEEKILTLYWNVYKFKTLFFLIPFLSYIFQISVLYRHEIFILLIIKYFCLLNIFFKKIKDTGDIAFIEFCCFLTFITFCISEVIIIEQYIPYIKDSNFKNFFKLDIYFDTGYLGVFLLLCLLDPIINYNLNLYKSFKRKRLCLKEIIYDETKDYSLKQADNKCAICLEQFLNKESMIRLKCNHMDHSFCLKEWFYGKDNPKCPRCNSLVY